MGRGADTVAPLAGGYSRSPGRVTPKTQTILTFPNIPPGEPVMASAGNVDLLCAGCERVMVEGVSAGQLMGIVFECPDCGVHGRTRT